MQEERIDIKSMTKDDLGALVASFGQPSFRTKQIFTFLHQKQVLSFEQMTNLPKSLMKTLNERCYVNEVTAQKVLESKRDFTKKVLLSLIDGECIELVIMKYRHGYSVCISSQVGCRMGCTFCASAKAGFIRNLTASEMLDQVYYADRYVKAIDDTARIGGIVLMGIGEPLDNYESVIKFLSIVSDSDGINIGSRHISISTCGVVPRIYDMASLSLGVTLSISLHAATDNLRSRTMPINNRYSIDELLAACKHYSSRTKRRISFEYALIKGVNDSKEDAKQLATLLLQKINTMNLVHVNLIPVNEIKDNQYKKSDNDSVLEFCSYLTSHGINATVRRTLGQDINAACGQLRRQFMIDNSETEVKT